MLTATASSFLTKSVDCSSVTCSGGKMADHCEKERSEAGRPVRQTKAGQADSPCLSAAFGKSPSLSCTVRGGFAVRNSRVSSR